jgi:transcriptional regulator with XRE-family HTH domain
MNSQSVLKYLSDAEMNALKEMTVGQRVYFLRERMNQLFRKEYTRNSIAKRINKSGIPITPMALHQLESDKIQSPRAFFLLGVAEELGVSMEFLLKGPEKEPSVVKTDRELTEALQDPKVRQIALRASERLTQEGKQVILNMLEKASEMVKAGV